MRTPEQVPVARRLSVREVMHPDVITVRDDMTLQEVAAFLVENQISGAPVEDAEGRLIGVVSYADIARATSEQTRLETVSPDAATSAALAAYFKRDYDEAPEGENLPELPAGAAAVTVREIMTPEVFSVTEDSPVAGAVRQMMDAHIHRLLVTRGHKVVGILTTSDLLALLVDGG